MMLRPSAIAFDMAAHRQKGKFMPDAIGHLDQGAGPRSFLSQAELFDLGGTESATRRGNFLVIAGPRAGKCRLLADLLARRR